ncbi:MAG: C10 family peptidase, partial [Bacteroidota bacterium]
MNITKINNHTLYRWNMQKSILILLFTLMANYIYAEKVSEQDASDVAVNFFKSETGLTSPKAILYYTQTEADGSIDFYIFNFVAVKGFVMVTADDNLEPVIAYSTESDFNLNGVEQTGVSDWIHDVRKQITAVVKQNLKADTRISDLWLAYKSGAGIIQPTAAAVLPLLTTIWNQESMISGVSHFNSLCPYNNFRNARSVTGCVATAMAQIMRYWKQPSAGTGSNSYNCVNSLSGYIYGTQSVNFGTTNYDWANMPDTVTATTSNAIDILMYHCGVAVEMDYGVNILPEKGSSSMTTGGSPSAQAAYVDYFGYRNTLQDVDASDYTTADWR